MSAPTEVLKLEALAFTAPLPPASAELLDSFVDRGDLLSACGVAGELQRIQSFNIHDLPARTTYMGMCEAGESLPAEVSAGAHSDASEGRHRKQDGFLWLVAPGLTVQEYYDTDRIDLTEKPTDVALSPAEQARVAAERVGLIEMSAVDDGIVTFFAPDGAQHFIKHDNPDVLINFLQRQGYHLPAPAEEPETVAPVHAEQVVTQPLDAPTIRIVAQFAVETSAGHSLAVETSGSNMLSPEATLGGAPGSQPVETTEAVAQSKSASNTERPTLARRNLRKTPKPGRFEQLQVVRYALGRVADLRPDHVELDQSTIQALTEQAIEANGSFASLEDLRTPEPIFGRKQGSTIRAALAALADSPGSEKATESDKMWAVAAEDILKRLTIVEPHDVIRRAAGRMRLATRSAGKKLRQLAAKFGRKQDAGTDNVAESNDPALASWLTGANTTR